MLLSSKYSFLLCAWQRVSRAAARIKAEETHGAAGQVAPSDDASAQFAGLAALTGPKDDVAKMCKAFDERRRFVVDALNKLPGVSCVDALGAFYVFPNTSKIGMTAKQVESGLLNDAGVATIA